MRNTFTNLRRASKRGLTLIEALLFLGIAAVVIVGAVLFYNNASNSARTNDALTQINAFATGIKGLHSGNPTYGTAALEAAAINGGVAPRNTVSGTALVNPWGGATNITGAGASFRISMAGIPQDSCVRIITAGLMTQGGVFAMRVNGAAATIPTAHAAGTAGAGTFVATTTPTPGEAATVCAGGNANALHFYVR